MRLHSLCPRSTLIVTLFAGAALASSCAGPKFMSSSTGDHDLVAELPRDRPLAIGPFTTDCTAQWDSLGAGEAFSSMLAIRLEGLSLFSGIVLADTAGAPPGALVLSGRITTSEDGYGSRAFGNGKVSVGIDAHIVDEGDSSRVLMTIRRSRSTSGGPFGMGGLLSADGSSLVHTMLRWIAEDVTGVVRREAARPESGESEALAEGGGR